MRNLLSDISSFIWGPPLLILLMGTHLFLTVRLRFIQRHIGTAIKLSFRTKPEGEGEISHFGALMTALAATIGTGNIIGVATAVAAGGPGAVLWMWLTGVFGIATKYSEAVLAVKYRVKHEDGTFSGGPMYALERGMNSKFLGVIFSVCTAIAAFGIGNMVQANAISHLVEHNVGIDPWLTGIVMTVLTALVMLGGIKSIARVCSLFVPFMAIFYIAGCLVLLVLGFERLPATMSLIVTSAFSGEAAAGGFIGATMIQAMRFGIARGLFSNEAGLGSAPIVAAAAQTLNPVRQALVSATGSFWDTVVICLLTGLVIVNAGDWMNISSAEALTSAAFGRLPFGQVFLTIALFTFVYSTILGWSYYGEKAIEYLGGAGVIRPYRWLWVFAVFVGSVLHLTVVWDIADILNGLMAIPNVISLVVLSGIVVQETRAHLPGIVKGG